MSVSAVTAAQGVHDVADTAEYVPSPQAAHALDGVLSVSAKPEAHAVQDCAAGAENDPALHATQPVAGFE